MLKNCRICGSNVIKLYPLKKGFEIYHCSTCNTDLTYPIPTLKDVEEATDPTYFEAFNDPSIRNFKTLDLKKTLTKLNSKKIKTYLDVGCAKGFLVEYMLSKKVDAYGIELFPDVAKEAQDLVGNRRIITGNFETFNFNKSYDLITMFDLIEHVKDPQKTLTKAKTILNPGGKILIITPNIRSWKRTLLRQNWTAYHLEHVNCFSCDSMNFFAKKTGLKLVSCESFHKTVNFHYFVRQLTHKFTFLSFLKIFTKFKTLNFPFTINDDSMLTIFENVE